MEQDQMVGMKPSHLAGLAGLAVLASSITALIVLFVLYSRRGRVAGGQSELEVETVSVQPAVNTSTPAQMPHHFSEDLLVPGFTHTGPEIEQDDSQHGRSAEGV